MRRLLLLIMVAALGSLLSTYALAQDEKKPGQAEAAKKNADDLQTIQQDFNKKQQEFFQAYQAAKSQEDKQKILKERPDPKPFLERALKLAEADPGTPAGVEALGWVLQMGGDSPTSKKAEELLVQGFITKAPLSEIASRLQRIRVFGATKLFDAVLGRVEAKTDDPAAAKLLGWVSNNAVYGAPKASEKATKLLFEKFVNDDALAAVCQHIGNRGGNPDVAIGQLRSVLGKSDNKKVLASATFGLAMLLKEKDANTQKEAETLFEKVLKDYANDNAAVANQAKSELSEMRLLGIGKNLPEIEGKDLQDKDFKISDYRGKVVLLDFWGFW
jgi:hypothetical protein